jgi:heat-inducible transcriptional repressor
MAENQRKKNENSFSKRKELILNIIIREHIKTGTPVGSGVIVDKYKLNISPATVRNEMMALEKEGFIIQPHTSAGRVPTEKAYLLYLENLKPARLNQKEAAGIKKTIGRRRELDFKNAAKVLAKLSGNAVFWALAQNNFYYTGLSNLWQQPEFRQMDLIYNISAVIDELDEVVENIFQRISDGIHILIGSQNPFGDFCSTVVVKYRQAGKAGLFGILGPIRMNYEKNIALVGFINEKIMRK